MCVKTQIRLKGMGSVTASASPTNNHKGNYETSLPKVRQRVA